MMFLLRHRHDAPSVPHFLPSEDGSLPEGREPQPLSPFISRSTIPTASAGFIASASSSNTGSTTFAASRVARIREPKRPRLFLLQGELLSLTGDGTSASLLGQLIYWNERVQDFELFAMEEKRNAFRSCSTFSHGWFCKSLEELRLEAMSRLSLSAFHEVLDVLVEQGWVQRRGKPLAPHKGSQAYYKIQLRVSLGKVCCDLHRKGYFHPGFAVYSVSPRSTKYGHSASQRNHHQADMVTNNHSSTSNRRFL